MKPGISENVISVVMPCLNEAETLATCIRKARSAIQETGVTGEVIVADNGSTDGSQQIAAREGARVVPTPVRGYGAALMGGIDAASSKYILMADADDSYSFSHLPRFLEALNRGADLVIGNRFKGRIEPDAMPPLHRYLGNPVLTLLGKLFFKAPVGDFHCGIRAFSKTAIQSLQLRTTGMEFASEMIVKASLAGLRIVEVPTNLSPDGRTRRPHLRTWRDGWRHLRFLLLYSPRWLFLYPGTILLVVGCLATIWLLPRERAIGSVHFDVGTLAYALAALLIGFHTCVFAVSAKIFGISERLLPADPKFERWFQYVTLEKGLAFGVLLLLVGFADAIYGLWRWAQSGFGPLTASLSIRLSLPAAAAVMLGVEVILTSFFLSLLGMKRR
ncbi:MAG: glycosyltransferase family 2 protein [Acidobacteriaceae bacterium]|nr:glycosyltransferase family 2 protein [Acidobacteriaceae bacterium]MBV9779883.1 glycosyltransferase family 2 protein [Acidobacteriaceae bacterium]